ncbi:DNA-directed RNA polymerase subunit D [Methanoculleus sp. UBA303]|jgi:DNA-directed RNA polymerase subunit D|uniref:DNA-directed RNA polymerase subunit D n=1 Tax=Methanoculleus sp. UBA303 TaxID=1915497 RepID=UPI0025EB145F|nr:DNA-directed RNA polymerase subunit D [Methanoculleus sp. UBA303]MDD3932415.1 DNA-directed RNA polymerase subunit D [Methanoculleus sp.]
MEIAFSRLDERVAKFTISGISTSFANMLRRAMISEVPTLAIEDVRIYDNTSVLFDEMLTHRLGLIPLRTDLKRYAPRAECTCEGVGCPVCTATYTLSVEGPKMVYSSDLIPQDPDAAPAEEKIPIISLGQEQKVVLEAYAIVSTGKEHAKWQATTACGYKNYPQITIDERCDGCGMCVDECPRNVLETGQGKVRVIGGRQEFCSLCRLCERACVAGGIGTEAAIHIGVDANRFIFVVEGDGSMPVREIIERALQYIQKSSDDLVDVMNDITGEGTE